MAVAVVVHFSQHGVGFRSVIPVQISFRVEIWRARAGSLIHSVLLFSFSFFFPFPSFFWQIFVLIREWAAGPSHGRIGPLGLLYLVSFLVHIYLWAFFLSIFVLN
ncbi:hypothetical protein ASPWEDRAFT_197804 [Aspergillus wentii DTO 134E9]|uniref:Uncharacterized protein n=1 Tax=Aspergillus wentii DTO 134E9 TaxID=1073089 RepID=A0A1L9RZA4_ASPWE|nr:uncharacterized protein ASPWEDRAFT_197804 [Aspergillus wentii DTO 134E9]OJJ40281.1 hypothetical protein ASPWEDRAFT_197804 [Aspergillus wentii DTO 134E9]